MITTVIATSTATLPSSRSDSLPIQSAEVPPADDEEEDSDFVPSSEDGMSVCSSLDNSNHSDTPSVDSAELSFLQQDAVEVPAPFSTLTGLGNNPPTTVSALLSSPGITTRRQSALRRSAANDSQGSLVFPDTQ